MSIPTSRAQRARVAYNTVKLVRRVGFRKADAVIELLSDWQDFMVAHGREPDGFEEYSVWTRRYSRMTAYRRLALLRGAFPEAGPNALPTDFLQGVLEAVRQELAEVD
jgi:hypothetical protein